MKRVLVTGSGGQLGRSIQKVSKSFPDLEFEFHNSDTLDITVYANIASIFSDGNFDYCINCAAYTNVEQAEKNSKAAHKVNAEAVEHLALNCSAYKVTLIHISTDYVFDGKKETGYLPDDITNPINEYGKSKLLGEVHVQEILKHYFIVRTSWLYSEFGKNFYKTILAKAELGENLKITDEQKGRPTNANNLADYLLNLIKNSATTYGIHHFADDEVLTWYGFAKKILKENDLEGKVRLDKAKNYYTSAARPKNSILDI